MSGGSAPRFHRKKNRLSQTSNDSFFRVVEGSPCPVPMQTAAYTGTQIGPAQISLYVQMGLTENGETIPVSQSDHHLSE